MPMPQTKTPLILAAILLGPIMIGCASKSHRVTLTGFLPESIQLEPSADDRNVLIYNDSSFDPATLDAVYVAAISTDHLKNHLPPDKLDQIALRMTRDIRETLAANLQILESPATNAPALYTALTKIDPSAPLLNIHPATKITGMGLGGASLEAMILAPDTQRVLYAIAFSRKAAKRVGSGLTKWDDAYTVIQHWAQDLAQQWQPQSESP